MGQRKLERFDAIASFPNVLQHPQNMAGHWSAFFKNANPITLELACGKGEYSTGLGAQHPERNFIGVDIKGNRIYIGAKKAAAEGLNNVAFLRAQIDQITDYFATGEVSDIWIVFPDPFLRESRAKNRLTHPRFLALYQRILKPGGVVRLKTDSRELFDFTREVAAAAGCRVLEEMEDIYGKGLATGPLAIQTFYEQMHRSEGRTIYYIAFTLPEKPIIYQKKKKPTANAGAERG